MTFKSLDLQMSIPRTPDASGIHSQLLQRPVAEQHMLASNASKETEQLRHKNTEVEEAGGQKIRDERQQGSNGQRGGGRQGKGGDEPDSAQPSIHPYKGKHIDISL